jgi:hypothetical protein
MRNPRSAIVFLFAFFAACHLHGRRHPHDPIGTDAAAVRDAFNADIGKVRVLMLVAPT